MRKLFKKYKGVLRFLGIFLGSYLLLSLLYHFYLTYSGGRGPDGITRLVALQTEAVLSFFGYDAQVSPVATGSSLNLFLNSELVARIIEGCNSISVLILFVSFMLAFFGRIQATLLFIFSGAILIYAINLLRIVLLTIGLYEIPQYGKFLHEVAFPLVIYGTVFLLWMLWIRIYSKQIRK